jgi:hypothetical protein
MAQEFDGVDDLTGLVEISQPSLKYRSIVGIAREAIYHQIDVLFLRYWNGKERAYGEMGHSLRAS